MKHFKRGLALLLTLALTFGCFATLAPAAFAEELEAVENFAVANVEQATGTLNLSDVGTTDWVHFSLNADGSRYSVPQVDRKAKPAEGGEPEIITLSTYATAEADGTSFGSINRAGGRFAQFLATASGELKNLKVNIVRLQNVDSPVNADLFVMNGDSYELVAATTIPAEKIPLFAFGDVEFEFPEAVYLFEGSYYALRLSDSNDSTDAECFSWSWATDVDTKYFDYGYYTTGEGFRLQSKYNESQVFSLEIHATSTGTEPVDIIQFETVGAAAMSTVMTDSPIAYSWLGGTPTEQASGVKTGGVIGYQNGSYVGDVTEEAGYRITIPASEQLQQVTFCSGIWSASAQIIAYVNGDKDNPVYSNDQLTADSTAQVLKYTITVAPNSSLEIYAKLTNKTNSYGNMSLGGIALSRVLPNPDLDYITLLNEEIAIAQDYLQLVNENEFTRRLAAFLPTAIEAAKGDEDGAFLAYTALHEMVLAVRNSIVTNNNYAFNGVSAQQQGSFGWEGDLHAPIAYADGSYLLRDNNAIRVTFGVTDLENGSVAWYNKDYYLPCFVSEYEKDDMQYTIENFADLLVIDGKKYEIAYSRMTVVNNSESTKILPLVSEALIPLNTAAERAATIQPGETIVRDYCIGADRFGGTYAWPADETLQAAGTWDEHYEHMKNFWEGRLANIASIDSVPADYQELIYAYKAGYIYTMIIADGYELHVGENGYDRVFDHDVIGILVTLVELGHTDNFREYCETILKNIQYPDAAWKFSYPFAVYLQKTNDYDTILYYWNDVQDKDGIVTNTHKIDSERVVYDPNVLDVDGNPARIMKETWAIDSLGYWTIDNYSSLMGLTSYAYLCQRMYEQYGEQTYLDEYDWAMAEYDSLMKSVDAVLKDTMEKYDFQYIPISMVMPNEMTSRANPRDANWASMYEFGRWDWDGYLFGCDQDNIMHELLDDTYAYILNAKKDVLPSPYTMGGYPGISSAYNAGYYEAALAGEEYRTYGVEAYLWWINNAMSCPYGSWEGINNSTTESLWNRVSATSGTGSCQHMWGQSMNTKVLLNSMLVEKADGTIIAGRGIPLTWNADGEEIAISNWLCTGGKRIGFNMKTEGLTVTFNLTGDALTSDVSLELPVTVENIESVSAGTFDNATGAVTIPAGVTTVVITMKSSAADLIDEESADLALTTAISAGESKNKPELYVAPSLSALSDAVTEGKRALENGTAAEKNAAAEKINECIAALILIKTYDTALDTYTGMTVGKNYTFGQQSDQRARYVTFLTGDTAVDLTELQVYLTTAHGGEQDDPIISIYTLAEDGKTLDTCIGSSSIPLSEVAEDMNSFTFGEAVHLEANTYYALHFSMDHSNGKYGNLGFYCTSDPVAFSYYHMKVRGNGNVVDESFLGMAMAILRTDRTDKTALNALYSDLLPAAEKALIANILLNPDATQEEIDALTARLANLSAALEVARMIDAIGEVNLESREAIESAREAYDALTGAEKALVANYAELVAAEAAYSALVADAAAKAAEEAQAAAEKAAQDAETAKSAAEAAAAEAGENSEAAEVAQKAAEDAQKAAEEAQAKADAAKTAAEAAAKAANESNIAAAAEAAKAAEEAAKAATEASNAAASAAEAAEAMERAQAAQKAAEDAQTAAEEAQAKAEEAQRKADEAAAASGEDKTAAEQARAEAEEAQKAAEAAQKAAEDAQTAAESAMTAAENSNKEAAQAAAEAAEYAKQVAEAYEEITRIKNEMIDLLAKAQAAAAKAEEERKAAEAAALAAAKYAAMMELSDALRNAENLSDCETADYLKVIQDAKEAVSAATTIAEVEAVRKAALEAVAAISCPSGEFADVEENTWYHEGVDYMVRLGYMNGVEKTVFDVNGDLTRGQLVTILYRIAGSSKSTAANPFEDVAAGKYYTDAIIWAAENGIVNGVSGTRFAPEESVTREQTAVILYRYAKATAAESDALAGFGDAGSVSNYAKDAMNWAVTEGLLNGSDGKLLPRDAASRAQIAAILMRWLTK